MKPLRIALIGLGVIGRRHIAEIRANRNCVLAAVADPSPAAPEEAKALGVPHYTDAVAMLDAEKPDAAIVCTPNHRHLDIGLECIERGIALLMEKPIADTLEAALALADAAGSADVPLLVGHHRRHNPIVTRTRELVRQQGIGKLVMVNIMCLMLKPDVYFEAEWRRQPGAGPVLINMIHEIDLVRFICGEVATVQAVSSNATRGFAVEDSIGCTLRLRNGALVNISLSDTTAAPWSWDISAGEDRTLFPQRLVPTHFFAGTEGACSMPDMTHWYYAGERGRTAPISDSRTTTVESNTYANQLNHFIAVARREAEPIIGGHDAARTLEVTLAMQRAGETGALIEMSGAGALA